MLTSHMFTADGPRSKHADRLFEELNGLINEQIVSPEFMLLWETPLTIDRAKYFSLMLIFYGANRRDCWAHVQARAPYDVKQAIWQHEQDELIHDPRGGADHVTLMSREAMALGVSEDELANAETTPLVRAALLAFTHLACNLPWLGGLTASHFLERRNNSKLVKGGGASYRWRDRLINELGVEPEKLKSLSVHIDADEDHSDLIEDAIARHVTDEESYKTALNGAREVMHIDRAFRAAAAHGMRAIET
ncbi:MAG TPA: iron-containing redox enzyme family protein [Alphaproteobacteria bacterium]|nr:iron-containing redox enzyme family protein [Alphaproteobacteria bacterium]